LLAEHTSAHAKPTAIGDFVREALAADSDINGGGETYRADEVHTWLEQLALDHATAPPKPIHK
jgi:hypothetical protein